MLKDIKTYDPECDDKRLNLVTLDAKNETATFGKVSDVNEILNGDKRFLEP